MAAHRTITSLLARAIGNPSALLIANAAAQSLIRLISNILLAGLLAPKIFALSSLTMLVITGIQMISDIGIAIIALRKGAMSPGDEDRLWTMQFLRGIGLMLVIWLFAGPIAQTYHDQELGQVLRVLAVLPALQGTQSLYPVLALARRDLKPSFIIEVGSRLLGAAVSVLVALASPTIWAIVAGTLLPTAFAVVVSHAMAGRAPKLIFDREFIRREWKMARWIQLSSTLSFVGMQIDKALFPFLFGLPALGLYTIGATFALIPAQITQRWSSGVFFPLTINMLNAGEVARARLLYLRMTMLIYTACAALAVMSIAPAFYYFLYRAEYHGAARFAQLLAAGIFFELAESSLRHFPLADDIARFELWPVIVRLAVFLLMVALLHGGGGGADAYALSYVIALAASYAFMLLVGVRRGYLRAGPDLPIAGAVLTAALVLYVFPFRELSLAVAVIGGIGATVIAIMLVAIYNRRGLPSLPTSRNERLIDPASTDARKEILLAAPPKSCG